MMAEVREVTFFFIAVVILKEKTEVKGSFINLTRETAATDSVSAAKAWSGQNPFHDLDHCYNHLNPQWVW